MPRERLPEQPPAPVGWSEPAPPDRYVLRLYVTGLTARSTQAISALRAVCEEHLRGRYDLEVFDLYEQPELARSEQIIAAPTLVKEQPLPLRRLVGNLCDTERVLVGLNLKGRRG